MNLSSNHGASENIATELCTINGVTYVSLPDTESLPQDQPGEILGSIKKVELTESLRSEISANSPHVHLINKRVIDLIRDRYSADDERKFANIGIGVALDLYAFAPGESDELLQFKDYLLQCRQWGRDQKALLGL